MKVSLLITFVLSTCSAFAGLEPGDKIQLSIRGLPAEDKGEIDGNYRLDDNGNVRLPMLERPVAARGLEPDQFARTAEKAFRDAEIFMQPVIEVEILEGIGQRAAAAVSVAGHVRRAGEMPYRKNMTVLQALDAAGGHNEFGGRNVQLFRDGKQYTLDFNNLAHKNIILKPGDSVHVEQKGALMDRWKGNDDRVRDLL
jgi:protein involved in polysaccharide export with SLBB domain